MPESAWDFLGPLELAGVGKGAKWAGKAMRKGAPKTFRAGKQAGAKAWGTGGAWSKDHAAKSAREAADKQRADDVDEILKSLGS